MRRLSLNQKIGLKELPRVYLINNLSGLDFVITDGKLCDQVVSILNDPRFNYSYISPNLVDKCGLRKEVHA